VLLQSQGKSANTLTGAASPVRIGRWEEYLLSVNLRASCRIGTTAYMHCVFLSVVHCMWKSQEGKW